MPLYEQIMNDIMKKITDKSLKEGDMLPTELELSRTYQVSRPTVRNALLQLVNQGYLNRIKGCGTFVTKPKLIQESTQFIESYNEEMLNKGFTPRTLVLELKIIPCPDEVCEKLHTPASEKVVKLKRLRFVQTSDSEKPVVLTTVYIPYYIYPSLINYDFEVFSLYEVLEKNNVIVNKVIRELEIKILHGKTAQLLETKENAPAHFITSTGYDEENHIIEYSESFYPADRNKFIIKIAR